MILSTENKPIPSGEDWTPIDIGSHYAFTIQNVAEVMMEYSFTDGLKRATYLTPYTFIVDIRQKIYVRFYNVQQNGEISITWVDRDD